MEILAGALHGEVVATLVVIIVDDRDCRRAQASGGGIEGHNKVPAGGGGDGCRERNHREVRGVRTGFHSQPPASVSRHKAGLARNNTRGETDLRRFLVARQARRAAGLFCRRLAGDLETHVVRCQ